MSESPQAERRSPERLQMELQLQAHEAWLESLDIRVAKGLLTNQEKNRRIALSLLRKEKKFRTEKTKNLYDPLSGLGRQEHLRPKIDEMITKGEPFGVLFTDLDKFKEINTEHGHLAGDEIIAQVGLRIQECLRVVSSEREEDEAFIGDSFRNGGDESAIVLKKVSTREQLVTIGDRIRSAINDAPFFLSAGQEIPMSVSIGGIIWNGQSRDDFLKQVDNYLYSAKDNRGSLVIG